MTKWTHAKKVMLLALISFFMFLFLPNMGFAVTGPTEKWHYDRPLGFKHSAPAIGNIDNSADGSQEIVIGNLDGNIYCFDENGQVRWTRYTGDGVDSTAALADVDGNGTLEIFVGSYNGYVYGLNYEGADLSMWGWPKLADGDWDNKGVFSSPAVGDIDGDGDKEVVVGSYSHNIWAWHYEGGVVAGWPFNNGDTVWSSPAIGDLDLDGQNEVVIGADCWSGPNWYPRGGLIWAFKGNGQVMKGWPKSTAQVIWSSPAIGDIDGDGFPEVVVGTGHYWTNVAGNRVYALRYNGTDLPGWPVETGDNLFSSPALGDVDHDGRLEVAIGGNDGYLYLIDDNGGIIWKQGLYEGDDVLSSPAIGDLDGDGEMEIIVGTYGKLAIWNADGSTYDTIPVHRITFNSPSLGDIDHDGKVEILYGAGVESTDGRLTVWDEAGTYSASGFPWPMFRHDPAHTASMPWSEPADPAWEVVASWYLAEGYTDNDFDEYLLLMNPYDTAAQVHIRFQFASGKSAVKTLVLGPHARETVFVDDVASQHDVSIKVLSDKKILSERSMYFNYNGKDGGHDSIGVTAPSNTWYLAEGFTGGDFDTWVLIQNPNASPAEIKATFMKKGGSTEERLYTVRGNSRFTIFVDDILPSDEVSTKIESTNGVEVIAERAMYFDYNGKDGGHNSIGVTAPSNTWYLAEGFTGGDFDTWVLIQNPNSAPAELKATFMKKGGSTVERTYTLGGNSRFTIFVDNILPNDEVSTKIESTNGVGVIAERAMYFNYNGKTDGHDSIGVTSPANTWYLTEGFTGGDFDTWVLVQNPNSSPAEIKATFMKRGGSTIERTYTVDGNSRFTIFVDDILPNDEVSTKIESTNGVGVIAERAMYFNYNGKDGGHSSIGARIDSE